MRIPLSSPDITQVERDAVLEVMHSPQLALGPKLDEFERRVAAYFERRHAVAVNSGTSALHLAMLAMNMSPGDEVITTPFSFVASTNCILYVGGVPRFVDIAADTWNMDMAGLSEAVNNRTRGILPVHVFGLPCDLDRVNACASENGLWIVEDACEAMGAYDGPGLVGRAAHATALAFYPNKQMTTGEGGILLTDDPHIDALCRSLRNQGRGQGRAWLSHERLGYNYRMNELSAALGIAQLGRIDDLLAKRAQVARWYDERVGQHPDLCGQAIPAGMRKSWFVYVLRLADRFTRADREAILGELKKRGIGCSDYFSPIHLQPYMQDRFGFRRGMFPVCESVADRTIALPFYGNLREHEVDLVCRILTEIIEKTATGSRGSIPRSRAQQPVDFTDRV